MRLNPELKLRKLGKHYMVVDPATETTNVANVYVLNGSSAWLWEQVADIDFDAMQLALLLCGEYDVETERAKADAEALFADWKRFGLLVD